MAGLHRLRELDHHHARQGVPVLAAWHISGGNTTQGVRVNKHTHCNISSKPVREDSDDAYLGLDKFV